MRYGISHRNIKSKQVIFYLSIFVLRKQTLIPPPKKKQTKKNTYEITYINLDMFIKTSTIWKLCIVFNRESKAIIVFWYFVTCPNGKTAYFHYLHLNCWFKGHTSHFFVICVLQSERTLNDLGKCWNENPQILNFQKRSIFQSSKLFWLKWITLYNMHIDWDQQFTKL